MVVAAALHVTDSCTSRDGVMVTLVVVVVVAAATGR